ncbi:MULTISPECIES: hypothetical protein [Mesonia]|uniref:Uncharacterized protein n=1 Tax=Mesonia oceanica TaxID=2687242 RepID=A0AC61Y3C0_9FLAO|nr:MULTISPECIES: hypothetical protein [Mesonia]MAN26353.1 hypothetical protein [Mesonia sp.]MBJ97489.1 hypothetical protein [Flavobacteriaceae bacterium]VVU98963.1 hypothetical protein FVB9532_00212 [Mesonia oceanica]
MKKDIEIPEVEGVHLVAVNQFNKDHRTHDWYAYLINENNYPLETVLIVSNGYDKKDKTSTMRHTLKVLGAKSFAKVEYLEPNVLKLNNEFSVSFFAEGKMLHRNFIFKKNSIAASNAKKVPLMKEEGILAS